MKIHHVYSIRDILAKEFAPPFVAKSDEVALRHFANVMTQTKGIQPGDFRLHCLGDWDDETGISNVRDEIVTEGFKHEN